MLLRTITVVLALASQGVAFAQGLVCPPAPQAGDRPCDTFHFHAQLYSPETKQFVDISGIHQFASQASCEKAREERLGRNAVLVEHMRRAGKNQQYPADRVGECHCDLTIVPSSESFLSEDQRRARIRMAEEIRMRIRERLLDSGVGSDSELVKGLTIVPPASALPPTPRLPSLPRITPLVTRRSADDLRPTRTVQAAGGPASQFELPLANISMDALRPLAAPPPAAGLAVIEPPPVVASETVTPAEEPAEEVRVAVDEPLPEDFADAFISFETERIQSILEASGELADEALRARTLEACIARIQLLSNLRALIRASGQDSRLSMAVRAAVEERQRLEIASRLFGDRVARHWAPVDPADIVVEGAGTTDPERLLSDPAADLEAQRQAMYALLSRAPLTEQQQGRLVSVIDRFLQ